MISFLIFQMLFFSSAKSLELRSLTDVSTHTVSLSDDEVKVFVVFQKDCVACRKQVQNLSCFEGKAETFLIGMFSSEKDLRKEYRSFHTKIKGYYGDGEFQKALGVTQPLTPQTLYLKEKKWHRLIGFFPCEKLMKKVKVSI